MDAALLAWRGAAAAAGGGGRWAALRAALAAAAERERHATRFVGHYPKSCIDKQTQLDAVYKDKPVKRKNAGKFTTDDGTSQDAGATVTSASVGILIAGNSGKPGGGVGEQGHIKGNPGTHCCWTKRYKVQEESVMQNWFWTQAARQTPTINADGTLSVPHNLHAANTRANELYALIKDKWGLKCPRCTSKKNTLYHQTKQGVDYTRAGAEKYYDAWSVANAELSDKQFKKHPYNALLVFVGAPQANPEAGMPNIHGSCQRTYNEGLNNDYDQFKAGIKNALEAGLDAMAHNDVDVAVVCKIGCGLYGNYDKRIGEEFDKLLQDVLQCNVSNDKQRGQYFEEVILATPKAVPGSGKTTNSGKQKKRRGKRRRKRK